MVYLYYYFLIAICCGLLLWGLTRVERVYQYPFFMSAIFIAFVIPQAYSLQHNPGSVPMTALVKLLLMSCLCITMCWLGYQVMPNKKILHTLNIELDDHKLFIIGIVLTIIGYASTLALNSTQAQIANNSNWTGIVTIYYFFLKVIYIALAIFLIQAISKPNLTKITWVIIAAVPAISPAIFAARRTLLMVVIVIFGLSFWFIKRYTPPRGLFIILVILGIYAIPLIGQFRSDVWGFVINADWSSISSASQQSLDRLIEGDVLELRNAAILIEASSSSNQYGYGTGLWDALVFQYFPGQFFGYELKKSLMFHWNVNHTGDLLGYIIPRGSTFTGIGDSFMEFSYFGSLIFASIGYIFKTLWISANYYKSKLSMLLYMGLLSPALICVTHGTSRFLQDAFFQFILAIAIVYFARIKTNVNYQ